MCVYRILIVYTVFHVAVKYIAYLSHDYPLGKPQPFSFYWTKGSRK